MYNKSITYRVVESVLVCDYVQFWGKKIVYNVVLRQKPLKNPQIALKEEHGKLSATAGFFLDRKTMRW